MFLARTSIVVGLSILVGVSCRTPKGIVANDDLKSLNSFKKDEEVRACKGKVTEPFSEQFDTYWAQKSIVANEGFKESLRPILAAVPAGLLKWFFLRGGDLQLVSKADDFCKASDRSSIALLGKNGDQVGCVNIATEVNSYLVPRIFVEVRGTTQEAQQAELSIAVQGFAVVTASYLSELGGGTTDASSQLSYVYGSGDTVMRNDKLALSFLFLDDLVNGQKANDLFIPDSMKAWIKDAKAYDGTVTRDDRWSAVYGLKDDNDFRQFTNAVLAHTLDSSWCGELTQEAGLESEVTFPQVRKWYSAKMEPELMATLNETDVDFTDSKVPIGAQQGSTGLGLTQSAAPDVSDQSLAAFSLAGGRFPILRGILRAPFAVVRYFAQNRPIAKWLAHHRPLRRAALAIFRGGARIIGGTGRVLFPGNRCWRIRRRLC